MCRICKFLANSEGEVINHIIETHPDIEDLAKNSDFEKDDEDKDSSDESIVEYKQKHRSSRVVPTNSETTSKSMSNHNVIYINIHMYIIFFSIIYKWISPWFI